MPAGWGLQQTTWAPGSDKTRGQSYNLVITTQKFKKEERTVHWTRFTKAGWTWHVTIYTNITLPLSQIFRLGSVSMFDHEFINDIILVYSFGSKANSNHCTVSKTPTSEWTLEKEIYWTLNMPYYRRDADEYFILAMVMFYFCIFLSIVGMNTQKCNLTLT